MSLLQYPNGIGILIKNNIDTFWYIYDTSIDNYSLIINIIGHDELHIINFNYIADRFFIQGINE